MLLSKVSTPAYPHQIPTNTDTKGGKPCIPKFQSAYSLSGDDIVQDEAIEVDNAGARRPNITSMGQASSRTTTNDRTSNGIPVHDETRYGQPDGGIEMIDMRLHTLPPVSNFGREVYIVTCDRLTVS